MPQNQKWAIACQRELAFVVPVHDQSCYVPTIHVFGGQKHVKQLHGLPRMRGDIPQCNAIRSVYNELTMANVLTMGRLFWISLYFEVCVQEPSAGDTTTTAGQCDSCGRVGVCTSTKMCRKTRRRRGLPLIDASAFHVVCSL
jgi:hypothetical protein